MSMFRILILIAINFLLVGCAVRSLELSESDKGAFYDPPKDKTLASLYLTCGKWALDGDYDSWRVPTEAPNCTYNVNGKKYSLIDKGEVGRLDIPAGKFTLDISSGGDPLRTLEVNSAEKILLVANFNQVTQAGSSFGLVGLAVAAVVKANSPPEKVMGNPLTIYKNDFMNQISMKKPVKVFVVEDK